MRRTEDGWSRPSACSQIFPEAEGAAAGGGGAVDGRCSVGVGVGPRAAARGGWQLCGFRGGGSVNFRRACRNTLAEITAKAVLEAKVLFRGPVGLDWCAQQF